MNSGSGPDRDDFGLPPVDVQIPDDARELDRDVQAYHRELRAQRRRRLLRRFASPVIRHGLVMPLVASCLAFTLLAGTLLTLFTAGQAAWGPPGAARRAATPPPTGHTGEPLPAANILLGGLETPLTALTGAVVAVVPPHCGCQAALRQLTGQALARQANVYLIGTGRAQVAGLARQLGLRGTQAGEDTQEVLAADYHLTGPAAILVRPDGLVAAVVRARGGRFPLGKALQAVVTGTPQGQG